jgi:Tfp pilus assembly protein PilN
MSRELINLLPPDRKRAFRRGYFFRLGTVAVLLLCAMVVIHGVFLLPSYLYLHAIKQTRETELAGLDAKLSGPEQEAITARLSSLEGSASYLARLDTVPTASAAVRGILAVPRSGVRLRSITFAPPTPGAADGKMTLSGVASTREALRAYVLALQQAPFVASAELPISAYAQETDIDFTITLTGSLQP